MQDKTKEKQIRTRDLPRYQDRVERLKAQYEDATWQRDEAIRQLSATHTHDQIVAILNGRLTRGRIGQIAPPKRAPRTSVRVDLDVDSKAGV